MNTWQPMRPARRALLTTNLALFSWALIVAIALLSFFVHVLNEQVRRGESLREQFRLGSQVSPASSEEHSLRLAEAEPSRKPVAAPR